MTYDFSLYITPDSDHQMTKIKTANITIFKISRVSIIDFYILVNNEYT